MRPEKKQRRTKCKLLVPQKPHQSNAHTLPPDTSQIVARQEEDMRKIQEDWLQREGPPPLPVSQLIVPKSPWNNELRSKYGLFPLTKTTAGKITTIVLQSRELPRCLKDMSCWDIGDKWMVLCLRPRMYATKLFKLLPGSYVAQGRSLYIATDIAQSLNRPQIHHTKLEVLKEKLIPSPGERVASLLMGGVDDFPQLLQKLKEEKDSTGLAYVIEHMNNIKEVIQSFK